MYISEPHALDVDIGKRKDTLILWDIRPSPHGELYEDLFDRLLKDHAERVRDIIETFKDRKVEYYKEGEKEGKVKRAKGFIKWGDKKIRVATDEEITELKEYLNDNNHSVA